MHRSLNEMEVGPGEALPAERRRAIVMPATPPARRLDSHLVMPVRPDRLRTEVAATAARFIAEEGCDYAQAKRRAMRELLGDGSDKRGAMPDNAEIEHELRRHLQLFAADTHPGLLAELRSLAVELMARLDPFNPHLVGAVLNGTATEHSDIELHLFTDSAKDVEVFLMDAGIDFDVESGADEGTPAALECLSFIAPTGGERVPSRGPRVGVRLHVFDQDAIRFAPRHKAASSPGFELHPVAASGRASLAAVRQLIEATR